MLVLIVDDEWEIREGLRRNFPWGEYGIEEAITADDGDTALELARLREPDLILTDIRMKRMTGLELIEQYAAECADGWRAIVISGYDDFEMVRSAMKLGAMDYLLKPINTSDLGEILKRMIDQLQKEKRDRDNEMLLQSHVQSALPKMREEVLRELVEFKYNAYRETRIAHRLRTLELDWLLGERLALLLVEVDDLRAVVSRNERNLILFGIGNVVRQTLEEDCAYRSVLYEDAKNRWVLLLACPDAARLELYKELGQLCIRRIHQFVKVNVSVALCSATDYASGLNAVYTETEEILEQKAVYGGNRLLTGVGWEVEAEQDNLSIRQPAEVLDLIRYGTDDEIRAAMEPFVEMVQCWSFTQIKDIQQRIFEWLLELFKKAWQHGWTDRTWERNPMAVWERLEQFDTLESLKEQTEQFLLTVAAGFRTQSVSPCQIIQAAEKFIRGRYADGLTLQSVAEEVHVTPVWLSKLFKKETGMTFLEYLTEIRMERAKRMLEEVQYKVYEVSTQVGYKDPVHFTKLFKKQTGHTPKEYRRLQGIAGHE
ncbi:helix-turn-helix domain-containing protein [Paenibacillus glycinis]|uniref:Response regulator n=1 Tax=Paenibacillus glycinis TaxID=2697035 RepID=A0ABW9XPU1_9BACL|nr:helix-turn-helix domain-containing protein [Paenibacillus glycinis]NBD24668.1 response regulator [Paenibacillus glycinis]